MDALKKYMPDHAFPYIEKLLTTHPVRLKIVKGRLTKFGDYRPANQGRPQQISINGDLNPYSFLITLVHEVAHAAAFKEYSHRIPPHGKEWKFTFQQLMLPLLTEDIFPQDILSPLKKHMLKPKASTSSDATLLRILKKYDRQALRFFLEDLPDGAVFQLLNGRRFIKGEKKRKNYLCQSVSNHRKYLINPLAEVRPIPENDR